MNNQLSKLDNINRALIGFDSVFDALERRYTNSAHTNYPPYNIIRLDDNHYNIEMAVTGFEKKEITVQVEANLLSITASSTEPIDPELVFLHRGLARRDFERTFTLAEHMKVISAEIKNGVLTIILEREIPESAKPKVIDIIELK